jgi:hypothetical protein
MGHFVSEEGVSFKPCCACAWGAYRRRVFGLLVTLVVAQAPSDGAERLPRGVVVYDDATRTNRLIPLLEVRLDDGRSGEVALDALRAVPGTSRGVEKYRAAMRTVMISNAVGWSLFLASAGLTLGAVVDANARQTRADPALLVLPLVGGLGAILISVGIAAGAWQDGADGLLDAMTVWSADPRVR